jgi:hypothetical protein
MNDDKTEKEKFWMVSTMEERFDKHVRITSD